MEWRIASVLGSIAIACVGGVESGGTLVRANVECPSASPDVRVWELTRSFELGGELLHPASYKRKTFDSRSPDYPPTLELWQDGAPGRYLELQLHPLDGLHPFGPTPGARSNKCRIRTRSGPVDALLERVPRTTVPSERDSVYVVRFRLPRSDGRTVVTFRGRTDNNAGHVEQIAIAQTLRLREMGAREPGLPRRPY